MNIQRELKFYRKKNCFAVGVDRAIDLFIISVVVFTKTILE
jgi:hypothetical protein